MTDSNDRGRIVWYELMSTDPSAAITFYTDIVGWTTQTWDTSGHPYTMWQASQGNLGGIMELPEPAKQMGVPPHWLAYVCVPDVDASAAVVRSLGGHVHVAPTDIPNVGRFAVIADPQGAALALFASQDAMREHDRTKPGEFMWSELMANDHEAAFAFYQELFGWERSDEFDMGDMGKYLLWGRKGVQLGGMMTKPPTMTMPPAWLHYIHVADLDAALARAKARGAQLLNGPMEVPGGARIAQLLDLQGAAFALLSGKPA